MTTVPTTVVVAFPWNADDEILAPLRERFPDLELVAAAVPRALRPPPPRPGRRAHRRGACGLGPRRGDASRSTSPRRSASSRPNLRWVQAIGAGIDHLADAGLPDDGDHHQRRRRRRRTDRRVRHEPAARRCGSASRDRRRAGAARVEAEVRSHRRRADPRGHRPRRHRHRGRGSGPAGSACYLIGTRRSYKEGQDHPAVDELRGTADLHDVLGRCDAVVVSAPGTAETENLFDAAAFAAMKPGALFCNVGRGSLVDEPALIAALESGHLGGAILDVTREEPLPADDPLWAAPNIYISPHCSAAQDRYTEKLLALFADNLERYTRGEPLRNVVDRAAGLLNTGSVRRLDTFRHDGVVVTAQRRVARLDRAHARRCRPRARHARDRPTSTAMARRHRPEARIAARAVPRRHRPLGRDTRSSSPSPATHRARARRRAARERARLALRGQRAGEGSRDPGADHVPSRPRVLPRRRRTGVHGVDTARPGRRRQRRGPLRARLAPRPHRVPPEPLRHDRVASRHRGGRRARPRRRPRAGALRHRARRHRGAPRPDDPRRVREHHPRPARRALSIRYAGDDARFRIKPGAPQKAHHASLVEGEPLGGAGVSAGLAG